MMTDGMKDGEQGEGVTMESLNGRAKSGPFESYSFLNLYQPLYGITRTKHGDILRRAFPEEGVTDERRGDTVNESFSARATVCRERPLAT